MTTMATEAFQLLVPFYYSIKKTALKQTNKLVQDCVYNALSGPVAFSFFSSPVVS